MYSLLGMGPGLADPNNHVSGDGAIHDHLSVMPPRAVHDAMQCRQSAVHRGQPVSCMACPGETTLSCEKESS